MKTRLLSYACGASRYGLALLMGGLLFGCASSSYNTVPRSSAGTIQTVDLGTVVATKDVQIDGQSTILGQASGGIIGSAVGQTVGQGDGRILAAAVGAVAGSIAGSQIEREVTTKRAQELTISLDDGSTVVVVQETKDPAFIEGDRVSVMHGRGGEARVTHSDFVSDQVYR